MSLYNIDQVAMERIRVIKLLLIAFIVVIGFGSLKNCSEFSIFGPSKIELKHEVKILNEKLLVLENQLKEAKAINKANEKAKLDREKAAEEAELIYKNAKKELDKELAKATEIKKEFHRRLDAINNDPGKSEEQKDREIANESIDLIWDMFCGTNDELCNNGVDSNNGV